MIYPALDFLRLKDLVENENKKGKKMKQLPISYKLSAISTLKYGDGISWEDHIDCMNWRIQCGPDRDTTRLTEKQTERIDSIFSHFFEG